MCEHFEESNSKIHNGMLLLVPGYHMCKVLFALVQCSVVYYSVLMSCMVFAGPPLSCVVLNWSFKLMYGPGGFAIILFDFGWPYGIYWPGGALH